MTIHAYLPRTNGFDTEAILAMSIAFELACADLRVFADNERGQEIIATRIIKLALQGTTDPAALRQRIVPSPSPSCCG